MCVVAPWLQARVPSAHLAALCGALLVAVLAATTATRVYAWGDATRLALTEAANHPSSARAQYEAGRMMLYTHAAVGDWSQGGRSAIPYFKKRSEEHTSELQSLMRISYAVLCLKKTNTRH